MNCPSTPSGILQTALWNVQQTAQRLGLAADIQRRIIDPKEQIQGTVHPVLPGGGMLHARFFLVRHNDVLGPAKGGIRMTSSVSLDEITGLAMEMTWKTSLIGVPFGGGKAGILYDPAQLDRHREGNPHPRLHPQRPSPPRPGNLRARPRHGHQRARHGPHPRLPLLLGGHGDHQRLFRDRQAGGAGRHRRPPRGHRQRRGGDHPARPAGG